MAKTIRIPDLPQVEVNLSGGRSILLRPPTVRTSIWTARRPGWGNAPGAVDAIVSRASKGALTEPEVRSLGVRDRHRLVLALVRLVEGGVGDWRNLYGSSLNFDERFLATMIWAQRRELRRAQASLREMRQRLIEQPPTNVSAMPPLPAGIPGLKSQLATMESLNRMTRAFTPLAGFQRPDIAGLKSGMGMGPDGPSGMTAAVKLLTESSFPSLAQQHLAASTKARQPSLVNAGLKPEGFRMTSPMDGLLPASGAKMRLLADGYLSSFSKQFEDSAGLNSVRKQLESVFGSAAFPGFNASAFQKGLRANFPGFRGGNFGLGGDFFGRTQELLESLMIREMARLWGDDPLWFLVAYFNPRKLPALLSASRENLLEAVLDGLESVVRGSTLTEQLIAACEGLSFLSPVQLTWLKHGLEHAHQGEWDQAMPFLILGFEGAIFNGAVAAEVIGGQEGKKLAAERVIKAVSLGEDLERFAIRLVFGGPGNATRHGRPENEMRDQVLPLIVALVGWLDFTLGTSGTENLAGQLEDSLVTTLGSEQRQHPALLTG